MLPAIDQDRALNFYLDTLGFEKRADFSYGNGSRWIEVAPAGSPNALALVPPSEGRPAGGHQAHCAFTSTDIEVDHVTFRARGADVDEQIARRGVARSGLVSIEATARDPVPPQVFIRDSEGNRILVVERA